MVLKNFFDLFKFTQSFACIERTVQMQSRKTFESNSEHSYQLAFLGWYLAEALDLGLNTQKILEYAIVHDLVEVYAGDTDPYKHSKEFIATKHERELDAIKRIKMEFPDFPNLAKTIENFEDMRDNEAKFIYLLDKIVPIVNTYLTKHSYYADNNVSYEKWQSWLRAKREKAKYADAKFNKLLDEIEGFFSKIELGFFKN